MTAARGKTPTLDVPAEYKESISRFFDNMGISGQIDPQGGTMSFADMIGGHLKVVHIERGKISCLFTVKPPIMNIYGGLHGGAVAGLATRVARGCVRTVVGVEKDIFLGELSVSYLSSAPHKAEVVVEGGVVRSGRNITVVTVDFRLKESGKLVYTSRATFYNMSPSRL